MSLFEFFIIGIALSMDAFAVSVCKGLSIKKLNIKAPVIVGLYFGSFQALMPFVGYLLGNAFKGYIMAFDHWVAFILLSLIGINMIKESKENECENDSSLSFKNMLVLAIATSIDALAVGVTFSFLDVKIIPAITIIGVTTFVLSMFGVKIGNIFGIKYKSKAEIFGGIILVVMGLKILIEHLFFE
ncbi:MAG: manganese efflux pump [Clostridia bacterium]|nr:manganese efflux pump [Clostridia bacterium]